MFKSPTTFTETALSWKPFTTPSSVWQFMEEAYFVNTGIYENSTILTDNGAIVFLTSSP